MSAIKIVKLENGDDIVCAFPKEQLPDKHALLRIERPLQIKYIPQLTPGGFKDYVALIKWASYTDDKIITIPKDKILTITNACAEVIKSYNDIKQEYNRPPVTPDSKKYIREKFSDDENRKINEIFNFYDDGDDTLH